MLPVGGQGRDQFYGRDDGGHARQVFPGHEYRRVGEQVGTFRTHETPDFGTVLRSPFPVRTGQGGTQGIPVQGNAMAGPVEPGRQGGARTVNRGIGMQAHGAGILHPRTGEELDPRRVTRHGRQTAHIS